MSAGRAVGLGSLVAWGSLGVAHAQSQKRPGSSSAKAVPAVQAPAALATKRARQTYREGVDAFNRSDYEAARIAFLQTLALKPDVPEVRRNLGLAQIYSGHYLEGARRVARVLHSPNAGSPQNRTRMLESLKKAEAHLERLTIEVDVDGALVEVDGEPLGLSPISYVWYVAPGHYELRVSKAGYVAHRQRRSSKAAKASHLRIALAVQPEPKPEAAAGEPSSAVLGNPPNDISSTPKPGPSGFIIGGVATVAGLVGGALFYYDAQRIGENWKGYKSELGDDVECGLSSNYPKECEDLASYENRHNLRRVLSASLFAFAGVAAIGTLGYWLWPRTAAGAREADGLSLRDVGFRFGQGEADLQLTGSF